MHIFGLWILNALYLITCEKWYVHLLLLLLAHDRYMHYCIHSQGLNLINRYYARNESIKQSTTADGTESDNNSFHKPWQPEEDKVWKRSWHTEQRLSVMSTPSWQSHCPVCCYRHYQYFHLHGSYMEHIHCWKDRSHLGKLHMYCLRSFQYNWCKSHCHHK